MTRYGLTKTILGSEWLADGLIANADGSVSKGFEFEPLSGGLLEEGFDGPQTQNFFTKLSDLISRLPNLFDGQFFLCRRLIEKAEVPGFITTLYCFERCPKESSYSHLNALLTVLGLRPVPISKKGWNALVEGTLGADRGEDRLPDVVWEREGLKVREKFVRVLSLTELPQLTWACSFQPIFESACEFAVSLRFSIPDRAKTRRQLETKRRVSHALSITSSLEVKNIESNSVLNSSQESLERILVGKETLLEMSLAVTLSGSKEETLKTARELERVASGIGNAGLFTEEVGTLPVLKSHLPGNKVLGIRKLPILSENFAHLLPIFHDYSRANDPSHLELRSRTGERCHLNLFSKENLNFNAFICGASGAGKSFLMNAILTSCLKDEPRSRLCIFDVGGSYRKIVTANNGVSAALTSNEARALIATFLRRYPVDQQGFFKNLVQTLCGSGPHVTHSHAVAIEDLLMELDGQALVFSKMIAAAATKKERFYQDIAHWLKPHVSLDEIASRPELTDLIRLPVTAFDFKCLSNDLILQKTTVLLLTELLWRDLVQGRFARTLTVFDEVWRFFAQSKSFLEEMYRTFRKYRGGIVSITQSVADYGEDEFAKMLFSTSHTKIFLQNGASAAFLKNTLDLPQSDIDRALSVASKKPHYSEFFALTPSMSQVFRLHPTQEFYQLANTENIAQAD